jgi:ABC-2 type transport system ATP-binding protein
MSRASATPWPGRYDDLELSGPADGSGQNMTGRPPCCYRAVSLGFTIAARVHHSLTWRPLPGSKIAAMSAVRVAGLVKRYGDVRALSGVDLRVEAGQIRGLLGPNGAGKSTLLRLLFGLARADAGTIELLGRAVRPADGPPLDGIAGFVEDPSFYPYLSGRANLDLLATLDGGPSAHTIDEALERVGLDRRAGDRVSGYSTGMRQRLGIAAALVRSPRVLLLDEPTSGLDPGGARAVAELLGELAADGVAILLSSHLLSEFENVCDAFTVLRGGSAVWSGTAAELRAQAPASAYALATSDDDVALRIAEEHPGIESGRLREGGLAITVDTGSLDGFVMALAGSGVAVRRLELLVSPLESMFFALTGDAAQQPAEARVLAEQALARA